MGNELSLKTDDYHEVSRLDKRSFLARTLRIFRVLVRLPSFFLIQIRTQESFFSVERKA